MCQINFSFFGGDLLLIEYLGSFESDFRDMVFYECKILNVFDNVKDNSRREIEDVIRKVFSLRGMQVKRLDNDLHVLNHTSDDTPQQTFNHSFYILKRLNDLLNLDLNMDGITTLKVIR